VRFHNGRLLTAEDVRANAVRVLLLRSALSSDGEVLVSAADSGIGLPAAHRDQLFDPFFTTRASGLGGGLTVSRLILESHGGRLWAAENAPRGAVFQFTLPYATSPSSAQEEMVG
jgi:signal transduction histidine kinase